VSKDLKPVVERVPRDATGSIELLTLRPIAWEYMYFAYHLLAGLERTEEKWRDFSLGYTLRSGRRVAEDELPSFVSENLSRVSMIAANIERVMSKEAQVAAFGEPGSPGDPKMIEHLANRLIQLYEALIDWTEDFRSHMYPDGSAVGALGAQLASQPVKSVRAFVQHYVDGLENELAQLSADRDHKFSLSLELKFELDSEGADLLVEEVRRIVGG
jgi:hypothetical protein